MGTCWGENTWAASSWASGSWITTVLDSLGAGDITNALVAWMRTLSWDITSSMRTTLIQRYPGTTTDHSTLLSRFMEDR